MKILAIDAGNTRIKWGVREGDGWAERGAHPTREVATIGEALAPWRSAECVVIANVAGEHVASTLASALGSAATPRWVVGRAEQCGVRSSYADPAQLGPDRWAALIAAHHLHGGACVVVNAGTTMTVDALSSDAIFLGGLIVPGYELMRGSLERNTARLGLREGTFSFFPDNTGDAIASGALNALAGAIERICRQLADTGEDDPFVVLSGGDAALLEPRLNARVEVVDNLVLEGLARIGASDV